LQRLIGQLGIKEMVDLPGFVTNPCSYMARAAVVALSSRSEALPTVLIEALACGVPIVATDCPCGPRQILAGGKYGRLVPVGDAPAMAAALLEALEGKVAAPPAASWAPYGVERVTREYLKVLCGRSCENTSGLS
jgi:glycosyltransferase involved in cell wall biosynthesis